MKTDARMLQDVMAEVQRGLAAQAANGKGPVPPVEIRVTLSGADGADGDTAQPAGSVFLWSRSPVAGACAARTGGQRASTERAGSA